MQEYDGGSQLIFVFISYDFRMRITYKMVQPTISAWEQTKRNPVPPRKDQVHRGLDKQRRKGRNGNKMEDKGRQKQKLAVFVEEAQGRKTLQSLRAITAQGFARAVWC